jgi:membrane protein
MRAMLTGSLRQFLPADAAALVTAAIQDLDSNAHHGGGLLVVAAVGATWAGINASWAMIAGLNVAYDTEEDRRWFEIAARAGCLAIMVIVLVMAALFGTHYIGRQLAGPTPGRILPRIAQWGAIVTILMISFAVFYRFGPNRAPGSKASRYRRRSGARLRNSLSTLSSTRRSFGASGSSALRRASTRLPSCETS